ncbi:hypothetical protein HO663_03175 [Streptococcus suis]|uniref:hypothetical protein n=1 Tax=Streptococcus suis TaxID=1307 RepID=UPI0005CE9A60|nr:hypothetical protein [Streptococcus suis]NQH27100.1 hypothetical protein [Streptococcus suis]NQH48559.1 hypothetical protein [Streptococcus suis]QBX21509.1 tail assembly protein [Streptococcus phage Javan577]
MQNIAIEPIYQKETEYKICCFFWGKSRSGGIEKKVDKICLDGDVYEPHTVKLTMNDDKNTAYSDLEKAYQSFVKSNADSRAKAEADLAEAGRRIELLVTHFNYSEDHFWEFIKSCIVAYKLVFGNPFKNSRQQLTAEDSQKMSHIIAKNLEKTAKEIKLHQEFRKRFNIQTRSFDDNKAEHPLLSKKQNF